MSYSSNTLDVERKVDLLTTIDNLSRILKYIKEIETMLLQINNISDKVNHSLSPENNHEKYYDQNHNDLKNVYEDTIASFKDIEKGFGNLKKDFEETIKIDPEILENKAEEIKNRILEIDTTHQITIDLNKFSETYSKVQQYDLIFGLLYNPSMISKIEEILYNLCRVKENLEQVKIHLENIMTLYNNSNSKIKELVTN